MQSGFVYEMPQWQRQQLWEVSAVTSSSSSSSSSSNSASVSAVGLSPRTDSQFDISVSRHQRYKRTVLDRTVCHSNPHCVQYCHVISSICDWCMIVFKNQFSIIKKLVSFVYFLFRSGVCCI